MKRLLSTALIVASCVLLFSPWAGAADWHHPLYLDGGGLWRTRLLVTVDNGADRVLEGEPIALRIGDGPGEARLVGERAEAVRVASDQGVEMLFALTRPDGSPIHRAEIPAGSTLVLPAECGVRQKATYYVYFDNPSAGELPDFLPMRMGLVNGDVEAGEGSAPTGWKHDPPDSQHRATWSTEHPQSGRRCLKTVVADGAEPTWIATRQQGIHVVAGAEYEMRAWVKAENVRGNAGWYIHVGNGENPMLIAPMLYGGEGTYDWRQVTARFKAPAQANRASLGTVLRGTGTAWFDNVTLECLEPGNVRAAAGAPERIDLREIGADAAWAEAPAGAARQSNHRALVRVLNLSESPVDNSLVAIHLGRLEARMRGRLRRGSIVVARGSRTVDRSFHGDQLVFEADVPPRTAAHYWVYFADEPRDGASAAEADLLLGKHNLVKNPSFEQGDDLPDGWSSTGPATGPDGVTFGVDAAAHEGLGRRSATMHVPRGATSAWRGWRQDVPVEPGRTYLLSAWVKCEGVESGEVRVHAHCRTADGGLSKHNPMVSMGPGISGTSDWTLMSGRFTMPDDTARFQIHLTTNDSGTVWHDGVMLTEILPGSVLRLEGRPVERPGAPCLWQVPAVVKVFREDPAPREPSALRIAAARTEWEPLQVAIRGPQSLADVRVEVVPPVGPGGARLDDVEVNVVGFVPIDHPTSYYRSDSPAWHRKVPTGPGACDGWPGMWPDPLLPRASFDLEADATQPVWITVAVPKDAPAGEYRGRIRLRSGSRTVVEAPFTVEVWDFTLPDESHVAAIYDVRLGRASELWDGSLDELYPEIVEFMARRRLSPDTIRPGPRIRYEDGRVVADFDEFDKAAHWYFDELKLRFAYTPWDFYLFGWAHPPKTLFGERPYPGDPPYDDADRSQLRPEYKKAYQACLKVFWDHLKAKGWADKVVLYISDEPHDWHDPIRVQMKALCDMIHEVDPEIPIYSSTWKHVPDWEGYLDVWGIGHDGRVPIDKMAELREAGDRLWFTTDGQMCTDTPYCAVERLLPHYCFKHGVEAYEFWGVAWLTYDPYRFGWHAYIHQSSEPGKWYYVRYPNGDGFLLYPGAPIGHEGLVSSIRLEQAREGVEDYEYLHLLQRLIAEAKAAGRDVAEAERVVREAGALVTIPNAGGRYSSKILPEPERLYALREALAAAIVQMAGR